jgi:leucyl aminopeptidase
MHLSLIAPSAIAGGAWIVGAFEGPVLTRTAERADTESGGALARALKVSKFTGKPEQILEVLAPANMRASRLVLVGLGKAEEFDAVRADHLAAHVVAKLLNSGETEATFQIDAPKEGKVKPGLLAAHLALGAKLRSYQFHTYRRKNLSEYETTLKTVNIATGNLEAAKREWTHLSAIADGVHFARDIVNEPPNVLSPEEFANRARALTKLGLKVEVLGEEEMQKLGMRALLGVGQGSARESQLVVMQWNGAEKPEKGKNGKPPIAFVGKGVCFDSGGLSLKTGPGMMGMKGDMGGAAAVTGAMISLATRKARVDAVGVVGLVENMPDGGAQRPDDVVESMSGQTIEILNTDAEGRLVLADALWYTQTRFKPRFVIDLATLTGAIVAALGSEHAGLFSNDDKLSERLIEAGREEGELVWRFPMGSAYDKLIKSKIADMKNIGGAYAGSITAAQFLQRFVNDVPWAHLDIAGTGMGSPADEINQSWGSGWGVRLLDRLVAEHYEG